MTEKSTHYSVISLNMNGFKSPMGEKKKKHCNSLSEKTLLPCLQETQLIAKNRYQLVVKGKKM